MGATAKKAAITRDAAERFVRAGVAAGKPHASLRDGTGLCLRLLPSGKASWQFIYRVNGLGRAGTPKTVTIGAWPAVDVEKARREARTLAGKVAERGDPRAEIRKEKRRERAVVAAALDDYEKWGESRRLRKVPTMMSALRRGLSHFMQRDLADLDRVALVDAIERIERSGRPGAARDFRKHLRTFLNGQLSAGVISIDPLAGYRMPAATKDDVIKAEKHRRSLSEDEIVVVWRAATNIGGPFGGLVKMSLLTGLRRDELAPMRWDWVDRQGLRITMPGEVMKNGRVHVVPIISLIAQLLDETPDRGGGLVFPSERRLGGATPMSGWSKMMTRLRRVSGVADVGLHNLRRSFRSALADLGVREELAEADRAPALRSGEALQSRAALGSAAGGGGKIRCVARERRFARRGR
jgi:integrase